MKSLQTVIYKIKLKLYDPNEEPENFEYVLDCFNNAYKNRSKIEILEKGNYKNKNRGRNEGAD